MTLSVAERTVRADDTASRLTHVTLYDGDPYGAGAEVPAIVRVAITWDAAANGVAAQAAGAVTITVPVGATFDHVVGMTAAVAGTAIAKRLIAPAQTFAGGGTVDVSNSEIAG